MTHVVSALFGAMLALLIYTRLGGMATTLTAGAIFVGYVIFETWRTYRDNLQARHDSAVATRRVAEMRKGDVHRFIDWSFTPWSDPEFTDVHDYRKADRVRPGAIPHRNLPIK